MIDSCTALPASLSPASAILPLPACQEPSAEVENGTVLRARVPPVDGLPDLPADTACLTIKFNRF